MAITPIIALLDLIAAGVQITVKMQQVFRDADAEGRNVSQAELLAAAEKSDRAKIRLDAAFSD